MRAGTSDTDKPGRSNGVGWHDATPGKERPSRQRPPAVLIFQSFQFSQIIQLYKFVHLQYIIFTTSLFFVINFQRQL